MDRWFPRWTVAQMHLEWEAVLRERGYWAFAMLFAAGDPQS